MSVIRKDQLQYSYQWSAVRPDDPRVTGVPDSTELNRHEGYEVLAFLNRVCREGLNQALKAERMIKLHLPGNLRSHAHVLSWLQANWSAYA
jgi:hypothetical protein